MHDEYGVGLILRGCQKSLSGRGTVTAGVGDVITCNPGEVHDGSPVGMGGRSWTMLYFDQERIGTLFDDLREGRGGSFEFEQPALRSSRTANGFHSLFSALTDQHIRGGPSAEELLVLLLAEMLPWRRSPLPCHSAAVKRVRERIDAAPDEAASLSELAREAELSRFQLLRIFRKATGLTPHAYLMQRRLHLARRLITGGMPLAEAAATSGFADQSHMTRLFGRIYGPSPGRFSPEAR